MWRKFKLTNARGASYDLQDLSKVSLFNEEGLGYDENADYLRIGTTYLPTSVRIAQHQITGTLVFRGSNVYTRYTEFCRFASYAPLTLSYTVDDTEYKIPVRMASIVKTDKQAPHTMTCSVTFLALGLWYKSVQTDVSGEESVLNAYPYTYDDTYSVTATQTAEIQSNSIQESPCRITIQGEAINPKWYHYVDGVLVASGGITGTVVANDRLVIDAISVPGEIKEYSNTGVEVADRYGVSDFSTERFIYLQEGRNEITVLHDGSTPLSFTVEARLEYETV